MEMNICTKLQSTCENELSSCIASRASLVWIHWSGRSKTGQSVTFFEIALSDTRRFRYETRNMFH